MTNKCLLPVTLLIASTPANADISMTVGDGRIDGTRLKPYEFDWQQCSAQDDQWSDGGLLTESLVIIGSGVLRHRQVTRQPDDVEIRADTFFDRSSFAPLRMEIEVSRNGALLASTLRQFDADGYTGHSFRGGEHSTDTGSITSNMLHGGAMGLPLATMARQQEPVSFVASMVNFDGTYDVTAEWTGSEVLHVDGTDIEAWLIDVEWHHRESGDVYGPGPDASGGRFWVVPNPPDGFPYVPRYKTDTYAVDFTGELCAQIEG